MINFTQQDNQDQLFGDRKSARNEYSTFEEQLQESTEKLLNEVFNTQYQPVYQPKQTQKVQKQYRKQKRNIKHSKFANSDLHENHKIYHNYAEGQFDQSFRNFLIRNQQFIEQKKTWVRKEKNRQQEQQSKGLKDVPDILRGSREKIDPIYDRCLQLQKSKESKIQAKRIQQNREQAERLKKISFAPIILNNSKQRTMDQYLVDKQKWQKNKIESIQMKKLASQARKLSSCTFTPLLISKYSKDNPRIIKGQKVEERLLRSLQKSVQREPKKR